MLVIIFRLVWAYILMTILLVFITKRQLWHYKWVVVAAQEIIEQLVTLLYYFVEAFLFIQRSKVEIRDLYMFFHYFIRRHFLALNR